jgi:hypothetical protein
VWETVVRPRPVVGALPSPKFQVKVKPAAVSPAEGSVAAPLRVTLAPSRPSAGTLVMVATGGALVTVTIAVALVERLVVSLAVAVTVKEPLSVNTWVTWRGLVGEALVSVCPSPNCHTMLVTRSPVFWSENVASKAAAPPSTTVCVAGASAIFGGFWASRTVTSRWSTALFPPSLSVAVTFTVKVPARAYVCGTAAWVSVTVEVVPRSALEGSAAVAVKVAADSAVTGTGNAPRVTVGATLVTTTSTLFAVVPPSLSLTVRVTW